MNVKKLNLDGKLNEVNFDLKKGEILGVAGLEGCGKIDLGKAIFGYYPNVTGQITVNNKNIKMKNTNEAINSKIALVPEDRKEGGLILDRGVKENITLSSLDKLSTTFKIDKKKEKAIAKNSINELKIKTPSINQPTRLLSGGNQQKVVLSKWLETDPEILILLEPTRGIDIGSKTEIYNLINNLTKEGISVIYVSSELTELVGICDRVLVMHEGSCSGIVSGNDINQERIMYLSSGGEMDAK
jgi:ribose transport system ATP-binding protein